MCGDCDPNTKATMSSRDFVHVDYTPHPIYEEPKAGEFGGGFGVRGAVDSVDPVSTEQRSASWWKDVCSANKMARVDNVRPSAVEIYRVWEEKYKHFNILAEEERREVWELACQVAIADNGEEERVARIVVSAIGEYDVYFAKEFLSLNIFQKRRQKELWFLDPYEKDNVPKKCEESLPVAAEWGEEDWG